MPIALPGNACVPPANGAARPPPFDAGGTPASGRRAVPKPSASGAAPIRPNRVRPHGPIPQGEMALGSIPHPLSPDDGLDDSERRTSASGAAPIRPNRVRPRGPIPQGGMALGSIPRPFSPNDGLDDSERRHPRDADHGPRAARRSRRRSHTRMTLAACASPRRSAASMPLRHADPASSGRSASSKARPRCCHAAE